MSFLKRLPKVLYSFEDRTTIFNDLTAFNDISLGDIDNMTTYSYYTIPEGSRPDQVSFDLYGTPNYYWTMFLVNASIREKGWPLGYTDLVNFIHKKYPNKSMLFTDDISDSFPVGATIRGLTSNAEGVIISKDTNLGKINIEVTSGTFVVEDIIDTTVAVPVNMTIHSTMDQYLAPHHYEDADGWADINPFTQDASVLTVVTNFDYEYALNDTLSNIRIIKPSHINRMLVQ